MRNSTVPIDIALPRVSACNILQAYKHIADSIEAHSSIPKDYILDHMIEAESKDSSAIGNGVALPYIKSSAVQKRHVVLLSLDHPIHMDTPDNKPVDLICFLLSPERDGSLHLRGLSRLSRLLKNEELCNVLREAPDASTMKSLFINPEGWLMAA